MRCLRLVALVSAALLTSARVNFQGPECMRSTPLSRTCFGERAAELSIDAARPGHCVLGLDAASDAACRRSLLVDTYSNIRAVIPGNAAVVDLMRNLLATDEALPLPFPVNFVPLDTEGAGALLRHPDGAPLPLAATAPRGSPSSKVFVALDKAALDTFSGGEAKYQTGAYTEMTRYKWRLAARLLEEDSPGAGPPPALLVSDPDIVFFRNPLPYLVSAVRLRTRRCVRVPRGQPSLSPLLPPPLLSPLAAPLCSPAYQPATCLSNQSSPL